jgi:hypothetical protein
MRAEFSEEGTFAHPNLIAGEATLVTEKHTILSGAGDLSAGAVLAKDSGNSNKLVLVDSDSGTSSIQTAYAVLAEGVDASAADAEAIVYVKGHFNEDALTFGADDTVADHRDALRDKGIFLSKNMGA